MVVSGLDALQWLRLHLSGGLVDGQQVLPRAALLETHRPTAVATPGKDILSLLCPGARMGAHALGWAAADLEGHPVVCHSGSDYGVTAMTLLLPKAGIGIAASANALSNVVVPLAHALAATLLALPPRDWLAYYRAAAAAITPPPEPAPDAGVQPALGPAAYAGTYIHPADGPLVVRHTGDGLARHFPDGALMAFDLKPLGGHRFAVAFKDVPTRLTLLGFKLEFQPCGDAVSAAVPHNPVGVTREFQRA